MEKKGRQVEIEVKMFLFGLFFLLVCTIVTYSLWFVFFLYLLGISFTDN